MKEPPMKTPSIVLCQSPLRPSRRADSSRQSADRRRNSDEGGCARSARYIRHRTLGNQTNQIKAPLSAYLAYSAVQPSKNRTFSKLFRALGSFGAMGLGPPLASMSK